MIHHASPEACLQRCFLSSNASDAGGENASLYSAREKQFNVESYALQCDAARMIDTKGPKVLGVSEEGYCQAVRANHDSAFNSESLLFQKWEESAQLLNVGPVPTTSIVLSQLPPSSCPNYLHRPLRTHLLLSLPDSHPLGRGRRRRHQLRRWQQRRQWQQQRRSRRRRTAASASRSGTFGFGFGGGF